MTIIQKGEPMDDLISRQAAIETVMECYDNDELFEVYEDKLRELPPAQPEQRNARVFQGIIVEYPSISAYPEYEGKPYFSIKYTVNGQKFIGYGTYKPEVLSEYLKEYFMPPAQPGWIPWDVRTPKHVEESYWICTDTGYQCQCRWTNNVFGLGARDEWGWKLLDIPQYSKVVAWQPLPTPYREGGQDG